MKYKIIRMYQDDRENKVIKRGLTLKQAQTHCQDPKTSGDGWFDGFEALHAIIETQKNRLLKIKWQEGQQCFMRQAPNSSAWMTMRPEEMDCQSFSDIMHATSDDSKDKASK